MAHIHRVKAALSALPMLRRAIYGFAGLVAVAAIGLPLYVFSATPDRVNPLQQAIRTLHFLPIEPPSTLRAPGTIYVVGDNGEIESALCWADDKNLTSMMRESATETQDTQSLRNATFDTSATLTQNLKEHVKGDLIQSVSFTLDDVSVLEVSVENLRALSADLQNKPSCGDSVVDYIHAGKHLCQGQQVLKATATYTIRTKQTADSEIIAKVTDAVRATIDPKATFDGKTVTVGHGLYYGMRLAPLCMALDDKGIAPPPQPRRPSFVGRLFERIGL
jgi:hypothetical protein